MAENWTVIRTVGTDEEALFIAEFLHSRGLPAEVESLISHELPVTFGELGEVRVHVPDEYADLAEELLAELAAEDELTGDGLGQAEDDDVSDEALAEEELEDEDEDDEDAEDWDPV